MVDVVGRYSNDPDTLRRLRRVLRMRQLGATRPAKAPVRVHAVTRRLTPDVRQELVDAYAAGSPTTALMEQYSLGKGTVLGILRRAGVELRNQGLNPTALLRAVALYEAGLSLKAVAAQVACDAETVRKELKLAGVQLRQPWERPRPAGQ